MQGYFVRFLIANNQKNKTENAISPYFGFKNRPLNFLTPIAEHLNRNRDPWDGIITILGVRTLQLSSIPKVEKKISEGMRIGEATKRITRWREILLKPELTSILFCHVDSKLQPNRVRE